jgi:hypothetical protein
MCGKTLTPRKNEKWELCDTKHKTQNTQFFLTKQNLLRTLFLQPTHQQVFFKCISRLLYLLKNGYTFFLYEYLHYKHARQIVQNLGYQFLFSKILICPLPERIKKVRIVFSHVVRRNSLRLRWYEFKWY